MVLDLFYFLLGVRPPIPIFKVWIMCRHCANAWFNLDALPWSGCRYWCGMGECCWRRTLLSLASRWHRS